MQKHKSILSILGVMALILVLAACSSGTVTTGTPGTSEPGTLPTLASTEATQSLTAVPTGSSLGTETPMATVESTQVATQTTPSGTQIIPSTGAPDPGRVSKLIGFSVLSKDNQPLGDVADLIFNLQTVQVDYVVVQNTDQKDILVPWAVVSINGAAADNGGGTPMPKNALMLTVDQSVFQNAPTIDLTTLPPAGEPAGTWDANIQTYWQNSLNTTGTGTPTPETTGTPAMTETPAASGQVGLQGVMRASVLMGYKLQIGADLANVSVDDVLLNVQSGAIQYVVIAIQNAASGEKLIPIPMSIFKWDSTNKALTLTVDPQIVESAPSFQSGAYPATQAPGWDADIHAYWQDKSGQ